MVVTRRTPVVPPTRNPSFRGAPRPPRGSTAKDIAGVSKNAALSTNAASSAGSSDGDKDHRNGLDNNSTPKTKKFRRRGKIKHQKSNFQAFLDFLTRLLLLAFIIYTFSVCPQDTHLQSPICRGLTEYKRIVLDPYIIPPIQAVLAHPSVAPHIERAKPYVHRAVEITTPILLRTQQEWNLHVVPQWEKRIVPEWNNRIVPLWNKHVVPQWDTHVAPQVQRVQSKVEPYRLSVVQEYEQRIAPRARVAFYNIQRWQRRAEPYVLLAVSKTRDGYHAAKPYAVPLARKLGHLLQQFAIFLREQRQTFVDPHVAKIWEKVKELSSGQVMPEPESSSSETSFSISPTRPLAPAYDTRETDVMDVSHSVTVHETAEVEPRSTSAELTSASEPEPATSAQHAVTPTGVEPLLTAESVFTDSLYESDHPTSILVEQLDTATSSVLIAMTTASSSRTLLAFDELVESPAQMTPSKVIVPAASATVPPMNSRADVEIDMDAFYTELGLDEPLGTPDGAEEYTSTPPGPPTETEEEKAERLRQKAEETARKRADIEARHVKWETELEAQMERGTFQLQNRLNALRTAAATELASSVEVRNSIEELVSEAEKYIKGAEIYLKNLKGESRRSEEKLALWDRVADRVNDKFYERLSATEGVVNAWHRIILDKEIQEVTIVTAEVREVAEKGQLDLGLDYAWLEDVTYDDWQRYHALITTSERYAQEAASVQNGTHAKVVVTNPMAAIFADLESEVQDVLIGFETRLRRIKRDGERAFNNHGNGVAPKEEDKGTFAEPEVDVDAHVSIPHDDFIPPVVIGRSQEEVLEALGKVEPVWEAGRVASGSNIDTSEARGGGAEIDHTEL